MSPQDALKKMIDAFNRHDAEAFAALHEDEAVVHDPQYAEPLRGRAAIRKDVADFFVTFPNIQTKLSSTLTNDDTAAGEFLMTGTNDGPIVTPEGDLPATWRRAEIRAAMFITVNAAGLVTESRRYFDMAGLSRQLALES